MYKSNLPKYLSHDRGFLRNKYLYPILMYNAKLWMYNGVTYHVQYIVQCTGYKEANYMLSTGGLGKTSFSCSKKKNLTLFLQGRGRLGWNKIQHIILNLN